MTCHPGTGEIFRNGRWECKGCGDETEIRRRPLTDYERMKLSWYRSDKKWIDNIRDRKTVTDRNGNKVVVSQGQVMPTQPRELWPKPKYQQS